MVNQTVSKTVVDFFAGKSEAEIEKYIALCKQAEAFQKTNNAVGYINPGRVIFYLFVSMRTDYDIRTMEPPHRIR